MNRTRVSIFGYPSVTARLDIPEIPSSPEYGAVNIIFGNRVADPARTSLFQGNKGGEHGFLRS